MNLYRHSIISLVILILIFSVSVSIIAQTLPSNGKIAFASDQDGDFEIYTMNADGTNVQQLTFNADDDTSPVWSPDSNQILFTSDRNEYIGIFVMNADGSDQVSLTSELPSFGGRWSPDGTKIVFIVNTNSRGKDVYVMNADGSNKINLTNDRLFINTFPFWSNDESSIYFLTDRDSTPGTALDPVSLAVYTMNADGSNPVRVFGAGIGITSIDLSPDGSKIVFGVWRLNPTLIVWDLNTSQETVLADGFNTAGASPAWSPDGNQIVFLHSSISDSLNISIMDANGANRTTLFAPTPSTDFSGLDWQPVTSTTNTTKEDSALLIVNNHSAP